MLDDYKARRDYYSSKRGVELAKVEAASNKKIEEEKAKRGPQVLKQREEERKTGAQDLGVVHRRMKHCARVLSNFGKLAAKDRYVVTELLIQSVLLTPFFPLPQVEIGIRRTASCRYCELLRI